MENAKDKDVYKCLPGLSPAKMGILVPAGPSNPSAPVTPEKYDTLLSSYHFQKVGNQT